ncbi:SGNH/GDSL hydrolase family protein [Rhizobium binxianense]
MILPNKEKIMLSISLNLTSNPAGGKQAPAALSPMKARLAGGRDATLLVLGDSTAYSADGPYYKFARAIGQAMNCSVRLFRWAEWAGSAPTGPKAYDEPVTLSAAAGPTLDVYLAALPGAVAGQMFHGARRGAALDAIPVPHCVIWHHGHNMLNFNVPFAGEYATCEGMYLGPLGMAEILWPGVPQIIVPQNPRRDDDGYAPVYSAMRAVAAAHPNLGFIDTYQPFLAAGKAANLYRPGSDGNQHPSDSSDNSAGAQLTAETLMAAWERASRSETYMTPAWPTMSGTQLLPNGDFSNWTGSFPAGFAPLGGGTVSKDFTDTFDGAPYSMAVFPNGNQNNGVARPFSAAEKVICAGKLLSVAALVKSPSTQPRPYLNFLIQSNGALRSFIQGDLINCQDGWMWLVISGVQADSILDNANTSIRLLAALALSAPTNNDPVKIQKIIVEEGPLPKGAF